MAGATLAPALPAIDAFFQTQPHATFWVKLLLTLPALFTAMTAPLVGWTIDRIGRKPLLIGATVLYGLAGGSGLVLSSLSGLLVGRAFLGMAVAGIMTTATTLMTDYYHGSQRNRVMSSQAAFMAYGGIVFQLLGGILADVGWRYPFAVYLMAFGVTGLVLGFIEEPTTASRLAIAPAESGSKSGAIVTPAIATPLLTLVGIYGLLFLSMVAFYLLPVHLPFYLHTFFGFSNTQTGIAFALLNLASALLSMQYKWGRKYLNFAGIQVFVCVMMGLGYVAIALAHSVMVMGAGLIWAGMGLGWLLPNLNLWLAAIASPERRGRLVGGLTTAMFLACIIHE